MWGYDRGRSGLAGSRSIPIRGERPGLFWRVAIVFAGISLVWILVVEGTGPLFGPGQTDRFGHAVRAVLIFALAVPLVVLARRFLDCRSWEGLRLGSLGAGWRALVFGAIFWLTAAGGGLVVASALGWSRISVGTPSVVDRAARPVPSGAGIPLRGFPGGVDLPGLLLSRPGG